MVASTDEHVALVDDLIGICRTRLMDPLEILLGGDPAVSTVEESVAVQAQVWAAQLLGPDDTTATTAIMRLIAALYPSDVAFDPPAHWWRTPLGQVVAQRVGHPYAESLPYSVAGSMLGITRQGVHDLVRRNKLGRHPDGGVTAESVRDRLRASSL